MTKSEQIKAIKEVVNWVKEKKQDPLNGIEEIEFILEQGQSLPIDSVSQQSEQLVCDCGNPSHCREGDTNKCWDCGKPIKAN